MPIQGIDHLLVAPRSQESSNVQKQNADKAPNQQNYLNNQMQNNVSHDLSSTKGTSESREKDEKYDAKEKGHNEYQRNERRKREKEEEDKKLQKEAGVGGSFLDIKI